MSDDREKLQEKAYEQLRSAILFSHHQPGERLQVKELCEELDMGRTPVREALLRLQQDGLIETVPQSGTYVSKIDLHAAECSRFVREQLEQEIYVECCAKAKDDDVSRLEGIIDHARTAKQEHDQLSFFENDNLFHEALFVIADREEVWGWVNSISTDLDRYRWLRILTEGLAWETIIDQHERIVDAIRNRQPSEARYLASRHLHMMFDERAQVIDSHASFFLGE